jgi:Ser/Thr protein kinase RdoA (MazF antagonist)
MVLPAQVMADILEAIREPYELGGGATVSRLGNGHINTTVLVHDGKRRLVAQKINTAVFPSPGALVANARAIHDHLAGKEERFRVARHVPGGDGRFLYGPEADVRVLEYFPNSRSIEVLENSEQARLAARNFARFSRLLTDFDHRQLETVIPDFHSPLLRYRQFDEAHESNIADRTCTCGSEIEFVRDREDRVRAWQGLLDTLPLHVCHNDCKINNMLVHNESGNALAIIDLDTCMPGCLMTDFGDLVRSCCSPEAEDSRNLERVVARPEVYSALMEGYLAGHDGTLSATERASLLPGALMMCFMVGLRFLTDYLSGDSYFSIDYPEHNLARARNQFRLYQSLEAQRDKLEGSC